MSARWAYPAALLLAVLLFCAPMFATPGGFLRGEPYRDHDWLIAATHDAIMRDTVLRHGQFPLRSHLVGGGYPVVAHPSDGSYSPLSLTSLLLGEVTGLKLNLIIALALGALGVFLLARDILGLGHAGALFAGLAFALSGWHPSRILVGYYESTFYLFFPLILYLVLTAGRSWRRLALGIGLTAVCVMQVLGGAAALVLWVLAHVAAGLRHGRFAQSRRRLLIQLGLVLMGAALLGAIKFVPMLDLLSRGQMDRMPQELLVKLPEEATDRFVFQRTFEYYTTFRKESRGGHLDFFYTNPGSLLHSLLRPVPLHNSYKTLPAGHVQATEPEYPYINVGPVVLLLAGFGLLLLPLMRVLWPVALVLLLSCWVCFGVHAPLDLFRPLSYLPVVNAMARPVQYFNFFILVELCLLGGAAVCWLERRLSHRAARAALLVALVLALLPTALDNALRYRRSFALPVPQLTREQTFFQLKLDNENLREQAASGYGNTYFNVLRGVGSILWDSNIKRPEHARPKYRVGDQGVRRLADGYRGEAFFERRGHQQNRVERLRVTPNRIDVDVVAKVGEVLVINQNFDPYWQADRCRILPNSDLLRLRCPAGNYRVTLRYRPNTLWLGLIGSGLGLLLLWWLRRVHGRWLLNPDHAGDPR